MASVCCPVSIVACFWHVWHQHITDWASTFHIFLVIRLDEFLFWPCLALASLSIQPVVHVRWRHLVVIWKRNILIRQVQRLVYGFEYCLTGEISISLSRLAQDATTPPGRILWTKFYPVFPSAGIWNLAGLPTGHVGDVNASIESSRQGRHLPTSRTPFDGPAQ